MTARRATSTRLDPAAADRLVKLCGLFSLQWRRRTGDHGEDGGHDLLRSNGLTWHDAAPTSSPDLVRSILKHAEALNEWEASFVSTLHGDLSPKQQVKLDQIVEKVHAHIRSKGI